MANSPVQHTIASDGTLRPQLAAACRKGRNFVYVHIQPQHECIITESGGFAVDFIGRVEHIDEDLGLVLAELEKRRPPEAPAVSARAKVHDVYEQLCIGKVLGCNCLSRRLVFS